MFLAVFLCPVIWSHSKAIRVAHYCRSGAEKASCVPFSENCCYLCVSSDGIEYRSGLCSEYRASPLSAFGDWGFIQAAGGSEACFLRLAACELTRNSRYCVCPLKTCFPCPLSISDLVTVFSHRHFLIRDLSNQYF